MLKINKSNLKTRIIALASITLSIFTISSCTNKNFNENEEINIIRKEFCVDDSTEEGGIYCISEYSLQGYRFINSGLDYYHSGYNEYFNIFKLKDGIYKKIKLEDIFNEKKDEFFRIVKNKFDLEIEKEKVIINEYDYYKNCFDDRAFIVRIKNFSFNDLKIDFEEGDSVRFILYADISKNLDYCSPFDVFEIIFHISEVKPFLELTEMLEPIQNDNKDYHILINSIIRDKYSYSDDILYDLKDNLLTFRDSGGMFLQGYEIDEKQEFIKGDIDGDNQPEKIARIFQSGGGGGGNVAWYETYVIYSKDNACVRIQDDVIINPPKNKGVSFEIKKVENQLLVGNLNVCVKRGMSKYDHLWQTYEAKAKLTNGKLLLIDYIINNAETQNPNK